MCDMNERKRMLCKCCLTQLVAVGNMITSARLFCVSVV